jgi:hypothetical protein
MKAGQRRGSMIDTGAPVGNWRCFNPVRRDKLSVVFTLHHDQPKNQPDQIKLSLSLRHDMLPS